uniref:Uncharacterized protein n=1 Tax=Oryza brachyantha TaxID=4533 RepID=J3NF39_ORYBR
ELSLSCPIDESCTFPSFLLLVSLFPLFSSLFSCFLVGRLGAWKETLGMHYIIICRLGITQQPSTHKGSNFVPLGADPKY